MDDLRSTLAGFDPDAPLPAAPDPWDSMPTPAVRPGPPWAMAEMIAAEPGLADRVAARLVADGSAASLARALRAGASGHDPVVVTGCGTSEHAAMATAAILREAWRAGGLSGRGPVAAQAFELALDPPAEGLVVGISHEGATTATIAAMAASRAAGGRTALITGSATSPAAAGADVVVATVEMDRSWCHTVGYVSPIVAAAVAASFLAGGAGAPAGLGRKLADGIEAAHAPGADGSRPDEVIAATIAGATHVLVVGTGADRIAARELALKLEEASWVPAAVRDLETLLHGHLPATGPETALVLLLTEHAGLEARAKRARQALSAAAALGIRPAAILGADAAGAIPESLTPGGRIVVPASPDLPAAVASLLGTAAPLQLVTLAVAAARGTNPDQIRRDDPRYLRASDLADDPTV
jgi:fructoselysine-6-P-deglycase FrlB-like protein